MVRTTGLPVNSGSACHERCLLGGSGVAGEFNCNGERGLGLEIDRTTLLIAGVGDASVEQPGRACEKVVAPGGDLRHRSLHCKAVKTILDWVTTGLHPELPAIRRDRGRQTGVALLICKRAGIGRAAAINVKSFDGHACHRGTYRRKRLRVPCIYMHTLGHGWRAAESTYGA